MPIADRTSRTFFSNGRAIAEERHLKRSDPENASEAFMDEQPTFHMFAADYRGPSCFDECRLVLAERIQ
jgi:hypothetical protein